MSRTTLCALTAAGLVTASLTLMAGRYHVLGDEVLVPRGPGTWKVTMKVTGKTADAGARLMTITPLDFDHQHVRQETFRSVELFDRPPTARPPERRQVYWLPRASTPPGAFTALYEFYCDMDVHGPSASMAQLTKTLYAAPQQGASLESQPLIESDHATITALARRLTVDREGTYDRMEALYQYVDQRVGNDPSVGAPGLSAVECLGQGRGDSRSKGRLLVALCRNRGIPARLVTGLALRRGHEQTAHVWVEAWVRDHWRPLCPFYHHFGRVPPTYLVFGFGDLPVVRGRNLLDLDYAFLVEHTTPEESAADAAVPAESGPRLRALVKQASLDVLPGPERRLVEFLLLIPLAGLIVCVYRNLIGVNSFGTFAPALVGLAFRELHSLPGILVFTSIVLLGWGMRRILDRFHLLQVPRTAVMLSLVVMVLILAVVAANYRRLEATRYVPLFPIVILTGMIERFWTLEVEDGAGSSFRTLLGTMFIASTIALFLSWEAVVNHMFRFPETLGLVLAVQLLIGRYTGYRLSELFRFRDFLTMQGTSASL
jgi:hypothetical protein